jgi:hypothetical protein
MLIFRKNLWFAKIGQFGQNCVKSGRTLENFSQLRNIRMFIQSKTFFVKPICQK